jgi:uroporphyrinogen III methyltransferase/synthase
MSTGALPLSGRRIAVTRAAHQATALVERLDALGAETIVCPAIAIEAPEHFQEFDRALRQVQSYDWILFTSANGATALFTRLEQLGIDRRIVQQCQIGAVGSTTASALAAYDIVPTVVPSRAVGRVLADELGSVAGQRILLPRAHIARSDLPLMLRQHGAIVDDIVAYRTVPGPGIHTLVERVHDKNVDAITFASSSAARNFMAGARAFDRDDPTWIDRIWSASSRPAIVCIGPVTAATVREINMPVDAVAEEHDVGGLVSALIKWFSTHTPRVRR